MKSFKKYLWLSLLAYSLILNVNAEKRRDGQTFEVNFDNWSVHANYAKGDPKCLSFANPDLQLRMFTGVTGKGGGISLGNEETCKYDMQGNFTPKHGTVSFWVAPQNWKISNEKFERFFTAHQKGFNMQIYKYLWSNFLFFYIKYDDAPGKNKVFVAKIKFNPSDWPLGKWHKIDCTWDRNGMKLYFDGILKPRFKWFTIPEVKFAQPIEFPAAAKDGKISLGFPTYAQKGKYYVADHKTAFDNVQIFNRPLSATEIKQNYEKYFPTTFGKNRQQQVLTIPFTTSSMKLDGKIEVQEWADASVVPVFEFLKGDIKNLNAKTYIKYAKDNLYIGFKTNQPVGRLNKNNQRDGKIWEDDCLELLLQSPQKNVYHFIVNSAGKIMDDKDTDRKWNTAAKAVASASGTGWSVEMVIPLKDMGGIDAFKNKNWHGNFCATYYSGNSTFFSGWSSPKLGYANPKGFGKFNFAIDNTAIRLTSLGNIYSGQLKLDAALAPAGAAKKYQLSACYQAEGGNKVEFPGQLSGKSWQTVLPPGKQFIRITAQDKTETIFSFEKYYYVNMPLELSYKCWPAKKYITVDVDLNNAGEKVLQAVKQRKLSGTITLDDSNGKNYSSATFTPQTSLETVKLKLPMDLAPGTYSIKATIDGNGTQIERSKPFRVPDMTPYREKVEMEHSVPPPWVAVKQTEPKTFSLLNRSYKFSNSPFPVSIINHGKEMLQTAPKLTINGKTVAWSDFKVGKQYVDYVCLSGKGRLGKLSFSWTGELWFDGLYKLNLNLQPEGKVNISSMKLNWTVPKQYAEFVLKPLLAPWKDNKVSLAFNPKISRRGVHFAWLTGHKLGLMWFPESKANWVNNKAEKQILITRSGNNVTTNVNIISKPAVLSKTAHYTMCFMATPAKPQPAKFRKLHFDGFGNPKGQTAQHIGWGTFRNKFYDEDTTSVASFVPRNPKTYAKTVAKWKKQNIKPLTYGMPTQISSGEPEYDYFINQWRSVPGNLHRLKKGGVKYTLNPCCGTGATDLQAWRIQKLLNDFPDLGGVYFDVCGVKFCENNAHGHGGIDAFGQPYMSSSALNLRDTLMRVYKVTKRKNRLFINHAHSYFHPVAHTFSDYWYPGEQYYRMIAENYKYAYCEGISLPEYQSELNGVIKGVGILFLPQYGRAAAGIQSIKPLLKEFNTNPEWAIRTITPLLVHDIDVTAAYIDRKVTVPKFWKIKDDNHFSDAEFFGYWTKPGAKSASPKVLVSVYRWKTPAPYRVVLAVSNMGRKVEPAALTLDAKRLGIGSKVEYFDLWNDKPLTVEALKTTQIKGNHFMLIGIK
jgi:Concanavalin A-like lectin/glucanases superfamily/Carbohydrate family 9 binding domain-like